MQARTLPSRHGLLWLAGGFALFRRNPPLVTTLTFAYLILVIVINLVPGIGPFLLPFLLPTLTAMLGNGCQAVERRRTLGFDVLTEGLSRHRIAMIRLGGLHLIGSILLLGVSQLLGGPKLDLSNGMSEEEAVALLGNMAVILTLASPLLLAFWFAPLLAAWDGVSAAKAVFFSFVASWRNWRAFAAYGVAVALVGVVIPGLLLVIAGLISPSLVKVLSIVLRMMLIFVLMPTLMASVYLSYRDVFHANPTVPNG